MTSRAEFEAWIDSNGLRRLCVGDDQQQGILAYWNCWQASLESSAYCDLLSALQSILNHGPDAMPIKEAFEVGRLAVHRALGGAQ